MAHAVGYLAVNEDGTCADVVLSRGDEVPQSEREAPAKPAMAIAADLPPSALH
jgi:hypothetical protein